MRHPGGARAPAAGAGRADTRVGATEGADGAPSVPRRAEACRGRGGVVESPELVRVRGLLCALRPDPKGTPLGWGPYERPPVAEEPHLGALAARIRVQTSPAVPSILPGAFASRAGVTAGVLAAGRVKEVTLHDPAARETLFWLQRHGTLETGIAGLYLAAAHALAVAAEQRRWASHKALRLRQEAARVAGRRRVLRAADVWEGLVVWVPCDACDGFCPSCSVCSGRGVREQAPSSDRLPENCAV